MKLNLLFLKYLFSNFLTFSSSDLFVSISQRKTFQKGEKLTLRASNKLLLTLTFAVLSTHIVGLTLWVSHCVSHKLSNSKEKSPMACSLVDRLSWWQNPGTRFGSSFVRVKSKFSFCVKIVTFLKSALREFADSEQFQFLCDLQ